MSWPSKRMLSIKVLTREEALNLFKSGKKTYHLICKPCGQEFFLASNRNYQNAISLSCPTCRRLQKFYLEDIKNYRIYKWQL